MVPKAGTYEVKLVNKGSVGHDVTFADGTQIVAAAGETKTAEVTVPASGMSFKCSVPGHAGKPRAAVRQRWIRSGSSAPECASLRLPARVAPVPAAARTPSRGALDFALLLLERKDVAAAAGRVSSR